jgi:hypothetical protein
MRKQVYLAGLILSCALPVHATTAAEVMAALQAKFTLTELNSWTGNIASPGTQMVVQKPGLFAGDPTAFNKKTRITNGQLARSGGSSLGGSLFGSGSAGHEVKVGDSVYISSLFGNPGNTGFTLKALTTSTYDVVSNGKTKSEHGALLIQFDYEGGLDALDTAAVVSDFAQWFKTTQEASESRTVRLGQTPAEVEAILGPPEKRIDLGPKQVFVYKDMKVVFLDGKVADVE